MATRISATWTLLTFCFCGPATAQGQEAQPVRATIVAIQGDDYLVDLGRNAVGDGQSLRIYRAIKVRHPITQQRLEDRFEIGTLQIVQTGQTLSIGRLSQQPDRVLQVGDAVEALVPAPVTSAPQSTPQAQGAAPAEADASATSAQDAAMDRPTRELLAYWHATLGQPPRRRIRYYRSFLQRHPQSRFSPGVAREVAHLEAELKRAQARAMDAEDPARAPARTARSHVSLDPIERIRIGEPTDLAVGAGGSVRSLLVHTRTTDQSDFSTHSAPLDESGHGRITLDAALSGEEGFEYFVESVDRDGRLRPVAGRAAQPLVPEVVAKPDRGHRTEPQTSVGFSSEWVSFDGMSGRDQFLITEGDFFSRLKLGLLSGLRMGYGHFRGEGGTVEALDVQGLDPEPATFSYGFVEAEFSLHTHFGAAVRTTAGLGRPASEDEQRDGLTGGFQLRLRIGQMSGTRLVVAGELMPEIGQRAFLGLHWETLEDFPMAAEVVVTDQPVDSNELAVRLIYQLGYRVSQRVTLSLRPSYQLRTIAHAGPGLGAAANFEF
ncbi:MAG: hypothetical protein OEZ06_06550 [Myxococcales bacterium]|nr:hypothetical protein [Myxococcales bacterium]